MKHRKTLKGATMTLAALAANGATANTPDENIIVEQVYDDDILITQFDDPDQTLIAPQDLAEPDSDIDIFADTSSFGEEADSYDVAELHWTYFGGTGDDNVITTPTRPKTIGDRFFSGNMMGGVAAIAAIAVLGWSWIRRRRKG